MTAGLVSGFLARGLREQAERRRAASVALARADAAREAQLAEQSRVEELTTELQTQAEDLQVTGEELRAQGEELRNRNDELSAQRDRLAENSERQLLLKELAEVGASVLSRAETGRRQVDLLTQALNTRTVLLFVLDEEQRHLIPLALEGLSNEYLSEHSGPVDVDGEGASAKVFRTRRPAFIRDVESDPSLSEYGKALTLALGQRSGASLPLVVGDEAIGSLALGWAESHAIDEDEVSFLESVASEIALGLQNADLLERLKAQAAELQAETDDLTARAAAAEALNAINALIHSTLDFDHVMQRALEQGVDAMATDVGAIELREQDSWIVRYQRGLSNAEIGRRMNDREAPCAARAASSREPFTIADLTAEGSMNVGLVASCDLRSVVSVPLIVRKEVIGCLLFYDHRPRSFSETEVDFARKLGVTVSLAVANARLFEVEQAELARVTVLKEVAVAAASSLEPARLAQTVLDRAGSLLGASKGSIYLVDPDAGVARHVALMGYSAESLPALETLPLDDRTLTGRAIMTGEVQAPDPGDVPPETVHRAQSVGMADDRIIAVPLLVRGAPVGSLGFGFPGRRPFRDHEVELYRAVADQLGAALENARLFEAEVAAERRASDELRNADLLLKSAKLLASGLDRQAILDTLAVVVLEALPHTRVTVQLWDPVNRTLTIAASHGARPAPTGAEIAFDQTSPAFRDMLERKATVVTDFDAVPSAARGQAGEYGSRLHLGVPLVADRELIGVLVVDDPGERRPFGEREIALLEAIAAQAATAIANAGVFERQRRIAQTLQENLIHQLPVVAGLELGVIAQTAYDPELVGGDFSDVFLLDDTHVVLLIADVAGKGVRAAGHTETVRSKVRALATIDPSPALVLARTNELLLRFDPDDPHVTAFLAVLDPTTGHLTYASAGHPAPVHLGAFSCRLLDVAFGPPLGSFSRAYANAHAMLTLEDYLVLYTDGVTEARQGTELLGSERLLEVVAGLRGRSAQEVADGVRDAALAYAGRLRDDLQVVVLRLA